MKRAIVRASKQSFLKSQNQSNGQAGYTRGVRAGVPGGAEAASQAPQTPDDPDDPGNNAEDDDVLTDISIGSLMMVNDVSEAPAGYDTSVSSRSLYGDVSDLANFTSNLSTQYYGADPSSQPFLLPTTASGTFADPIDCINNAGQRALITTYLDYLENRNPEDPLLRCVVFGQAGTGKSFTMSIIRACAMMSTGSPRSIIAIAPTGAAAGGIGASTVDRALKIKRNCKEFQQLSAQDPGHCPTAREASGRSCRCRRRVLNVGSEVDGALCQPLG